MKRVLYEGGSKYRGNCLKGELNGGGIVWREEEDMIKYVCI